MIDRNHKLSISRQAKASGVSSSSVYYLPKPISKDILSLCGGWMNRIKAIPLPGAVCCNGF